MTKKYENGKRLEKKRVFSNSHKRKGKMDKQLIRVTWEDFGIMCEKLKNKIKRDKIDFGGIYDIPRGGRALGLYLSHQLNLPLLDKPNKNCLLVDDIKESGKTSQNLPRKKFACLYTSSWVKNKPDYYVKVKKKKNSWIIFPWECFETEKYILGYIFSFLIVFINYYKFIF